MSRSRLETWHFVLRRSRVLGIQFGMSSFKCEPPGFFFFFFRFVHPSLILSSPISKDLSSILSFRVKHSRPINIPFKSNPSIGSIEIEARRLKDMADSPPSTQRFSSPCFLQYSDAERNSRLTSYTIKPQSSLACCSIHFPRPR